LQILDGIMRSSAAAGAYQKLAAKAGVEVDLLNPDKGLVAEAQRLTRFSQGTSFFKDQPLALTRGFGLTETGAKSANVSLNKTILTFQSFMLNRWDNIKRQIWRLGIKEGDYKKAIMSFFWLFVFATAMEEGIRRGTKKAIGLVTGMTPENDSLLGSMVKNAIQSIPLVGSLMGSLEYGSNPVPAIRTFEDLIGGAKSVYSGKAPQTKIRGGVRALGSLGALFGIPGSTQAAQLIRDSIEPASGSNKNSSFNPFIKNTNRDSNPFIQ